MGRWWGGVAILGPKPCKNDRWCWTYPHQLSATLMQNVFLLFTLQLDSWLPSVPEAGIPDGRWSILSHIQGRNLLPKSQFQDKYVVPAIRLASKNTAMSKCFVQGNARGIIKLQRGINCIMLKKSVEKGRHYWKATSNTPPPKFIFGRRKIDGSDLLGHPVCSSRPHVEVVFKKGVCVLSLIYPFSNLIFVRRHLPGFQLPSCLLSKRGNEREDSLEHFRNKPYNYHMLILLRFLRSCLLGKVKSKAPQWLFANSRESFCSVTLEKVPDLSEPQAPQLGYRNSK